MAHEGLFRLGIAANPIAFLVDIALITALYGDFDVVCVSSQVEGEFSRLLSIQINHITLPYETRAQLTQALCEHLGIQYITPGDDDTAFPREDLERIAAPSGR